MPRSACWPVSPSALQQTRGRCPARSHVVTEPELAQCSRQGVNTADCCTAPHLDLHCQLPAAGQQRRGTLRLGPAVAVAIAWQGWWRCVTGHLLELGHQAADLVMHCMILRHLQRLHASQQQPAALSVYALRGKERVAIQDIGECVLCDTEQGCCRESLVATAAPGLNR